jgi:DNA-binding MarR family transcriptional regulator
VLGPRGYEDGLRQDKDIAVGDMGRLAGLVTELASRNECSPAELLERVSRLLGDASPEVRRRRVILTEFVSRIRRLRVRRNELFEVPLFRDPAWDMLLELFVASERGEGLTVTSLSHASGVPLTTALRHLQRMEEFGLIFREGDRKDNRLTVIRSTPQANARVGAVASMLLDETETWARIAERKATEPTFHERFVAHVWGTVQN